MRDEDTWENVEIAVVVILIVLCTFALYAAGA